MSAYVQVRGSVDQTDASAKPKLKLNADGSLSMPTGTSSQTVQGTAADGATAVGAPVQTGGVDGSGNAQAFATDTSGNQTAVGNVASAATDSGNPVKVGAKYNATRPTYTDGQRGDLQIDTKGNLGVSIIANQTTGADGFGNTSIGLVYNATTQGALLLANAPYVFNGTTWDRQTKPANASRILSAANTTNATNAKNGAGTLHRVSGNTARASVCYLKFYNKATAPTVGTDVPVLTFALKASDVFNIDLSPYGFYFSTGISYALTTGSADADTGALTAGDVLGLNVIYS